MELAPTRKDGAQAQASWMKSVSLPRPEGPCCHGRDVLGRHAATMVFDEPMVNVISIWIETTSCKHERFFCTDVCSNLEMKMQYFVCTDV